MVEIEIDKYFLSIKSKPYVVEGFFEHEIIVAKTGTYYQVYTVVHNKKKKYDAWNLFEEYYHYIDKKDWSDTGRDLWETKVKEISNMQKKEKAKKFNWLK